MILYNRTLIDNSTNIGADEVILYKYVLYYYQGSENERM